MSLLHYTRTNNFRFDTSHITESYHIDRLGCYISDANGTNTDAKIELFALWTIPALVILLAASIAMVIMRV